MLLETLVVLSNLVGSGGDGGQTPGNQPSQHQSNSDVMSQNKLRDYLFQHPQYLSAAIEFKIGTECLIYAESLKDPAERLHYDEQCFRAAHVLLMELDIAPAMLHHQAVVISFSHELSNWSFRAEIQALLTEFLQSDKDLNFLKSSLEKLPGAPTWDDFISVLFQDELASQIYYLEDHFKTGREKEITTLRDANTKFYDLLADPLQRVSVVSQATRSDRFYHCFVIRDLAQRLQRNGVDPGVAAFTTFFFNYIYEIQAYQGTLKTVFIDPVAIKNDGTIDDLYLGYLGAYHNFKRLAPESFYTLFRTNNDAALRAVIATGSAGVSGENLHH